MSQGERSASYHEMSQGLLTITLVNEGNICEESTDKTTYITKYDYGSNNFVTDVNFQGLGNHSIRMECKHITDDGDDNISPLSCKRQNSEGDPTFGKSQKNYKNLDYNNYQGSNTPVMEHKSSKDLFEKFSKKSANVAIKTEVKTLIKHLAKKLIKELRSNKERKVNIESLVIDGSFGRSEKDGQETNSIIDDILVVEPLFYECTNTEDKNQEIQDLYQNYRSKTTNSDPPPPLIIDQVCPNENCLSTNFQPPKGCPKQEMTETSQNMTSRKSDDVSRKFSNFLNCMSGQDDGSELLLKSELIKQKLKSSSRSIIQRLFSKHRYNNRNSSCRTTPAYFTTTKLEKSNSMIDKFNFSINLSNHSSPTGFLESERTATRNEWLEVESSMKDDGLNRPLDSLPLTSSCQGTMRKLSKSSSSKQISKIDKTVNAKSVTENICTETSKNSGAVFIID